LQRLGGGALHTQPPLSAFAHAEAGAALRIAHEALVARCPIPVLDTPDEVVLPRDCFYDTAYHLNREGVRRRVERLIPLLRAQLR
jgi:hypothetical protein